MSRITVLFLLEFNLRSEINITSSLFPVTASSFLSVTSFFVEVFRERTFCEEKFKLILLHSLLKCPISKLAWFREVFRLFFANYL